MLDAGQGSGGYQLVGFFSVSSFTCLSLTIQISAVFVKMAVHFGNHCFQKLWGKF